MRVHLVIWLCLATGIDKYGILCEVKKIRDRRKVEDIPMLIAVASDEKEDDDSIEDEPKRLVCYLNFETKPDPKDKRGTIKVINDKSGYDNNGDFSTGGEILKFSEKDFTCNQAARLWDSEIHFKGDLFQAKPRKAITIAAWVKLEEMPGQHSIFDTIGKRHEQGLFHFEVNDGVLRWFHRNDCKQTVFETMAHVVPKDKWTHVAGTYDAKTKQAKVYINGALRNQSIGDGELSRDWAARAGIGNHMKHRPLRGSIDEFRIHNYALKPDEIKALVGACRGADAEARSETAEARSETAEARSETAEARLEIVKSEAEAKKGKRRRRSTKKEENGRKRQKVTETKSCITKRSIYLNF